MGIVATLFKWTPSLGTSEVLLRHLNSVIASGIDPARIATLARQISDAGDDILEVQRLLRQFSEANGNAIETVALSVLRHGYGEANEGLAVAMGGLLKHDSTGRLCGVLIPELDRSLKRFASRRDIDVADVAIEEWVQATRGGGRPRAILQVLLGAALPTAGKGTRSSQQGKFWHKFFPRPEYPPVSNASLVSFLKNRADFDALVSEIYAQRAAAGLPMPDINVIKARFQSYLRLQVNGDNIFDSILVVDSNPLADFGEDALKNLIGNQKLSHTELVHRMFDAHDLLEQTMRATGSGNLNDLWDIPGAHGLIQKVITRSGHQKAYLFELEVITGFVKEMKQGSEIIDIVLQVRIGAAEGPDVVLIKLAQGPEQAFIVQAKSWSRVTALLGSGGEMMRQTGSDLRRFWADSGYSEPLLMWIPRVGPDGSMRQMELMEFGDIFEFVVDEGRLIKSLDAPLDANGVPMTGNLLNNIKDAAYASVDEMNDMLTSNHAINSTIGEAQLEAVLSGSNRHFRSGSDLVYSAGGLRGHLQAIVNANPDMAVRELMLIRMVMDKTGAYDENLVRVLMDRQPPIQFSITFQNQRNVIPEGPNYHADDYFDLDQAAGAGP